MTNFVEISPTSFSSKIKSKENISLTHFFHLLKIFPQYSKNGKTFEYKQSQILLNQESLNNILGLAMKKEISSLKTLKILAFASVKENSDICSYILHHNLKVQDKRCIADFDQTASSADLIYTTKLRKTVIIIITRLILDVTNLKTIIFLISNKLNKQTWWAKKTHSR